MTRVLVRSILAAVATIVFIQVSAVVPQSATASTLRRRAVRFPSPPSAPQTQTVTLAPSKDNTLYQTTNGSLSNGSGVHIFAGATNRRELRRALIAFDVAPRIPAGSRIIRAVLTLHVSQTISGPESVALHRVLKAWGEAGSNAGSSRDGTGTASGAGDATWIHTFFPDQRWSTAGGDFEATADATSQVDGIGDYVWGSAATIQRVQEWLDQPSTNFGWIVIGNEATSATTKRFDSREISPSDTRPSLTIDFTHP